MVVGVIETSKLAWGDALNIFGGDDFIAPATDEKTAGGELGSMAHLESNVVFAVLRKGVERKEIGLAHEELAPVGGLRLETVRYIDDIAANVFAHHVPRAAAEAEAFALADGKEPIAEVLTYDVAGFLFHYEAFFLAEIFPCEFGEAYFPQEADTLAVVAMCRCEVFAFGNVADFLLEEMPDGEHDFTQSEVVELCEEVGLIFHRVGTGGEPHVAVGVAFGLGVMARGHAVVLMSHALLEDPEFDVFIAHHIGVGR